MARGHFDFGLFCVLKSGAATDHMPEPATVDVAPAQPAGLDAGLDSAIAQMEQSLFPARGGQDGQTPSGTDASPTHESSASTEQPAADAAPEPGGEPEDTEEDQDTPAEPGKPPSRMGRLRQQLSEAEQKARGYEAYLAHQQQLQEHALRQFVDLVLPEAEFEQLRLRAEKGDWDASQKLDTARTWRQMAAPISDLAHRAAKRDFDIALQEMRALDGMDGDSHQKLLSAASPGDKLKLMWQLGQKTAEAAHKERIAALEQEVQALKTTRAATGSQPANGGAPRRNGTGLDGLVGRDGQLTDDAMNLSPREIRARFGSAA